MNLSKNKKEKWDVNEKIKRKRLAGLMKDLYDNEEPIPSKVEIIDLYLVNPEHFKNPREDYQIKYRW